MELVNQSSDHPRAVTSHTHHPVSKRIAVQRIVTSLLIVSVICQFPFVALAPKAAQLAVLMNLIVSVIMFSIVIRLSTIRTFFIARFLLISTFILFISYSSWLWGVDHHTQWFLLLGIVIVTYLFSPKETLGLLTSYFAFSMVFLAFELHFASLPNHSISHELAVPPRNWKSFSNAFFMVLACIAVALNVRSIMNGHWQSLFKRSTSLQDTIDSIFPSTFIPNENKQQAQTQHYRNVSVLFIDMSCYSEFAASQPIHKHVDLLHHAYTVFDQILSDKGVVRIKTNGDQYIAAIGIPLTATENSATNFKPERPDQRAFQLCDAAKSIQKEFAEVCLAFEFKSQLKMGIASGDVTAGFIGNLRPTFDVWGEPMIIAARLEKHCPGNDIILCPNTNDLIQSSDMNTEFKGNYRFKGLRQLSLYRLLSND